jgi:hypothetical protein
MPELNGMWYPDLKPVDKATVARLDGESVMYHYEPGNGTRYEAVFARIYRTEQSKLYPRVILTICNFDRPCSMVVPDVQKLTENDLEYIREKMGVLAGDAWALLHLINHYLTMWNPPYRAGAPSPGNVS